MTVTDRVFRGLATLKAKAPEAVVTVVSSGNTSTGLRSTNSNEGALEQVGQSSPETLTVWVKSSEIGDIVDGNEITIDGRTAFVRGHALDPCRALTRIDAQYQKPVVFET